MDKHGETTITLYIQCINALEENRRKFLKMLEVKMFPSDYEELKARVEELERLLAVNISITHTLDAIEVATTVLHTALTTVQAEAGALWLISEDREYLNPVVAIGSKADNLKGLRLRRGEGLAGKVAESGEPVLVKDVVGDSRWASRFDSSTGFVTRTMVVVPLICNNESVGSLQLINKQNELFFDEDDMRFCMALAAGSAQSIVNSRIFTNQNKFLNSALKCIIAAIDARDNNREHSERVSQYALLIARELGLSEQEMDLIEKSALLHDIGKINVPESILLNTGLIDKRMWEKLKKHPVVGGQIVYQMEPKNYIRQIWAGVVYHHERYDGTGYPSGLKGEDIPLAARIITIAESYDTITTVSLNFKSKPIDDALHELERYAGVIYDPFLVRLFVRGMRSVNS